MSGQSPGPWEFIARVGKIERGGVLDYEPVYDLAKLIDGTDADGYLMAAAPSLLAACQAARELLIALGWLKWVRENNGDESAVAAQLEAAIAKAEGR